MPEQGRPGGGNKITGAQPGNGSVPGQAAPPTEGLLGPETPPHGQPTVIPLAPAPQPTEGLLRPAVAVNEDTLTPEDWRRTLHPAYGAELPADLRAGAPGAAPWPDRMRTLLRTPMAERPAFERTPRDQKPDAIAKNVPRVLDLALRIGELLLASGEASEDVEAAMLGIAHAYGLDHCEPQVTFTLISISYQPSLVDAPVTADRVVRRRTTDYTRLAAIYRLVADITAESVTVNDAYRRLAEIRRNRHPYSPWALALATGLLAGAATFLVGGRLDGKALLVFVNAFLAAILGDRLASAVAKRGLPEFYQYVLAAMPAALFGILLSFNGFGLRGSVVITGGLFALLPGRAMVAAVQDGLTGFYITAAARLLEVVYLITGIVIGVMLVLYAGVNFNAHLRPDEALGGSVNPPLQLVAALVVALAFAMLLQSDRASLPLAVVNAGIGWSTYGVLVNAKVSPIIATGVAAGLVGLFGQLAARYRATSALPYVTPALGPLLPGSALYLGMLALAQGHTSAGLVSVSTAAARAMALAVGVNLGGEAARLFMKAPGRTERLGLAPQLLAPRRASKRTLGF